MVKTLSRGCVFVSPRKEDNGEYYEKEKGVQHVSLRRRCARSYSRDIYCGTSGNGGRVNISDRKRKHDLCFVVSRLCDSDTILAKIRYFGIGNGYGEIAENARPPT